MEIMEQIKQEFMDDLKLDVTDIEEESEHGVLSYKVIAVDEDQEEQEYLVFQDEDDAKQYAESYVEDMINDEPGSFEPDWLSSYIKVPAGDIASDMVDHMYSMDKKEFLDNYRDDYAWNKKSENFDAYKDRVTEEEKERIEEEIEDDPYKYFVEEQGIYDRWNFFKQPFVTIFSDSAAQDAIDADGVEHFLATYDGDEVETTNFVAYRTD